MSAIQENDDTGSLVAGNQNRIPDFDKGDGLIPVVIQDVHTLEVLMLGYMNREAYEKTFSERRVTFFSRSKNRLWTKGEESGYYLELESMHLDCDSDSLLVKCRPAGPTCHTGDRSCFQTEHEANFIFQLEEIVRSRFENPVEGSYVNKLRSRGIHKIAQKVGEEGVEIVIAALVEDRQHFVDESSDLIFHLLVLLREKGITLQDLGVNLRKRHEGSK